MRKDLHEGNNPRQVRRKLAYVKSAEEIPDLMSDDEVAQWYQTHSTVLIQDQMDTLPAKVGSKLRSRILARRKKAGRARKVKTSSPTNP